MKKTFIIIIVVSILLSCNRNDKILAATDELHYIHLYEKGNVFEILHNGLNTYHGTYIISNDTVFLTYNKDELLSRKRNAYDILTRKLLINTDLKRIKSVDNKHFCANIYLDTRIK